MAFGTKCYVASIIKLFSKCSHFYSSSISFSITNYVVNHICIIDVESTYTGLLLVN